MKSKVNRQERYAQVDIGKRGRLEIHYQDKTAVILPEYFGEKMNWVVTGFIQKNEPKR